MTVGNKLVDFFIDTGPTFSVLNSKLAKASSEIVTVSKTSPKALLEATGVSDRRDLFEAVSLYMPECPIPLLGRDLLSKLNARVTFSQERMDIKVPPEQTCSLQATLL